MSHPTIGRTGITALAALLAGLSAIVAAELGSAPMDEPSMNDASKPGRATPDLQPAQPYARPHVLGRTGSEEWVATILARPLFAATRRPAPGRTEPGMLAPGLPRVTGILVDGSRRTVIFASNGSDRPMAVGEGGEINGFRVQSIESSRVTVLGPEGISVVRPSFEPRPALQGPVAGAGR